MAFSSTGRNTVKLPSDVAARATASSSSHSNFFFGARRIGRAVEDMRSACVGEGAGSARGALRCGDGATTRLSKRENRSFTLSSAHESAIYQR